MVKVKSEQLIDFVRAIAGAFIMQRLPLRALAQILKDLIDYEEVQLAKLLRDATVTMASTTARGSYITKKVQSLLLEQERKRKRH